MAVGEPGLAVSTGLHQARGDCSVRATDLSGHLRQVSPHQPQLSGLLSQLILCFGQVYLCEESHIQDWSLDCDRLCSEVSNY